MAEIIRMPRMSDTMEEGVIVEWLKNEGDPVEPGDVLAEVETDKATMELESYHEGVLLHIGVKEGPVPVNGILAVIGEEGEDFQEALAEAEKETPSNGSENGEEATDDQASESKEENGSDEDKSEPAPSSTPQPAQAGTADDKRIKASPLARSMASEAGINLSNVNGSGDQGRIVKRDIEAYLSQKPSPAEAPAKEEKRKGGLDFQPFTGGALDQPDEEFNVSQMRKTIARRLGESKFSAPHFYLTIELDMDRAVAARNSMNELSPVKLSFNDMVVKAAAMALRQHPAVNSSWLGDKIRRNGNINVGVAVAVDEGLLVPVVRHADHKTLSQINTEVKELAAKARNRKLQPDEMEGNTFTISNLGMFGIEEFTAIINPPDSCILAVGGIQEKAVVVNGELAVGKRMKVTLSCDHRVVDGATGAKFLQTFKAMVEDPVRILI